MAFVGRVADAKLDFKIMGFGDISLHVVPFCCSIQNFIEILFMFQLNMAI